MSAVTFADRLAQARALVARGAQPLPGHLADQLGAAGAEAGALHDRIGAALPILDPRRGWRRREEAAPSDETRAYLLAALFGCAAVCVHLRRGGPRPAFVRLPLRRIDCERCTRTLRRPPSDEDDRCDICGARGVAIFHPFAVRLGPTLVLGDACAGCAGGIGIVQAVAS